MDSERISAVFGSYPDPVLFVKDGATLYRNAAAQKLLADNETKCKQLTRIFSKAPESASLHLGGVTYRITCSTLPEGTLVILAPMPAQPAMSPFTLSEAVTAQLRWQTASAWAAQQQMEEALHRNGMMQYDMLMAVQVQSACRLLRIVQQLELDRRLNEEAAIKGPVDLVALTDDLCREVASLAEAAGIDFTWNTSATSMLTSGNPEMLRHMLLALISNALKAAGADGKAGLKLERDGNRAIFTVWDNGSGIAPHILGRIYQPGRPAGIPGPNDGLGLGIPVARRIAEQHGGSLMLANNPSGGTWAVAFIRLEMPDKMTLRTPLRTPDPGGFSPVLVGLSDALPWKAFREME